MQWFLAKHSISHVRRPPVLFLTLEETMKGKGLMTWKQLNVMQVLLALAGMVE
jgi:hypothetical protein